MARQLSTSTAVYVLLEDIMNLVQLQTTIILYFYLRNGRRLRRRHRRQLSRHYSILDRIPRQVCYMNRLVSVSDIDCLVNLRVDRNTFGRLCILLKEVGGLRNSRYVFVEEQVAMFLGILAHHNKNRLIGFHFKRSGKSVSHYVHLVLLAVIRLHTILLPKPELVTDDNDDPRWKYFKGCIGALDGTYINILVRNMDKPHYRNRKGHIATNTLAVCERKMRFIFFLPGWEGSAGDAHVLRDAVTRQDGLKVPKSCQMSYIN